MPAFEFFQPTSVEDAQVLLRRYGADAWVLAGGLDSLDWLKDRIKRPEALVDLGSIPGLKGIRESDGELEIGAMTTLTELAGHPIVRERYSILLEAAEAAASPQIRNQGTIGGNVSQDTRCWYYRAGWPCYRAGGNLCYADAPEAINREHAIFHADRCVAVNPSDTAPALIVLDAGMVIRAADGTEHVVPAEDYFVGPGIDITRMTILEPGDLLTAIRLPPTWRGAKFYFEKVRDRQVWDFALVSVASAILMTRPREGSGGQDGVIERMRIAVNGVAARPLRLQAVEMLAQGRPANEGTAVVAANLAVDGAQPLKFNAYKVPLMRNLVKRAIRGVEPTTWNS
jgi:xanthine dehydrogenase YagS FAD-binding subunit